MPPFQRGGPAALLAALALLSTTIAVANDPCPGDCNADGHVTAAELLNGVALALGQNGAPCTSLGTDADGSVTVDRLLSAVNAAVTDCAPVMTPTPRLSPTATVAPMPSPTVTSTPSHFCDLPGSVQTTATGVVVVPGGPTNAPDIRYLHLPVGFCAHFYARLNNVRQLRFAPGGELFAASPTTTTTGGGSSGLAAIVVLPDDNHDGVADSTTKFLTNLPSTQGLLFTNGYFYYQDATKIMRIPYTAGERTPSGPSTLVANITVYISSIHWPKVLDAADDGTIYVTNGGDQGEPCVTPHPFHGGILKLDASPDGVTEVAKGFRNPIGIRCSRGHNLCYAVELARDFSADEGGREKVVPIRQGDDWGFPCCATKDLPFPDTRPTDCSGVASEDASFVIGETPFDVDFEPGKWPAPWTHGAFVPLHGEAGTWTGARLVSIGTDPATGELLPGSDLGGTPSGTFADFATGWDDGTRAHGRPANVAFAPDGRLFLGNDNNGDIVWIAPMGL